MQTRIDHVKKTALYAFDSLGELTAWIASSPRTWRETTAQDGPKDNQWDLNTGYAKSLRMASDGWIEGAQRVQDALRVFAPTTPQPDTKTDFYGFRPHVPRFCAGAPDNMIRHVYAAEMGSGRVLTLAVSLDANAYTSAASMANFGAAVAQYINQLETQGTRVHVIGALVSDMRHRTGWHEAHAFTVKNADQPLDLAVLAFAIGHPAMLRRIGLAAMERSAAPNCPGYGSAVDCKLSDIVNAPLGTVILNGMKDANANAPTPEAALEYVSSQIDKAMEAQYADQP